MGPAELRIDLHRLAQVFLRLRAGRRVRRRRAPRDTASRHPAGDSLPASRRNGSASRVRPWLARNTAKSRRGAGDPRSHATALRNHSSACRVLAADRRQPRQPHHARRLVGLVARDRLHLGHRRMIDRQPVERRPRRLEAHRLERVAEQLVEQVAVVAALADDQGRRGAHQRIGIVGRGRPPAGRPACRCSHGAIRRSRVARHAAISSTS